MDVDENEDEDEDGYGHGGQVWKREKKWMKNDQTGHSLLYN